MNWIKENKFLAALCVGSLLGIIALYFVGSAANNRYTEAKENFDASFEEATNFEHGTLYPTQENKDGKIKALEEYKTSIDSLQADFAPYRSGELKNVTPQEFANHLNAVSAEITKAFNAAETKVPDQFFYGFREYKSRLASANATGILGYQLDSIRAIMLALAKSEITELKSIYRPKLSEENDVAFVPKDSDVARKLPLEITFQGGEKSVRSFISAIEKSTPPYVIIRVISIQNLKQAPPRKTDAKFEKPATSADVAMPDASSDAIPLPAEGATPLPATQEGQKEEPSQPQQAQAQQQPEETVPPAVQPSAGRILDQVLGKEQLLVRMRLEIMQFLPSKKLP